MRVLELPSSITADFLAAQVPRVSIHSDMVVGEVRSLIAEVGARGGAALLEQSLKFDGARPSKLLLDERDLSLALDSLSKDLRTALEEAIRRVRVVSEAVLPQSSKVEPTPGGTIVNRFMPVSAAGVYVPGGKSSYPSSVVMNVVAAQVAGVPRIVIASPPKSKTGLPDPTVLAVAGMLGIREVLVAGGAGAIAALAYGLSDLGFLPVDVVTGPGNRYVAAAKSAVGHLVAIDSEAGPTEIMVLADESANPEFVAADLISQAEHDESAAAILVTNSAQLASRVSALVEQRLSLEQNRERAGFSLQSDQSAILVSKTWAGVLDVANLYAPEHLSLQCREPRVAAAAIRNAGAIFVGDYSPVSLGDYLAGSNHVLPTGGAAMRRAVLNPGVFLRLQQLVEFDSDALAGSAAGIKLLTQAENLPAHYSAILARIQSMAMKMEN